MKRPQHHFVALVITLYVNYGALASSVRQLSEEEPIVELDTGFLSDSEVHTLKAMAKDMGYHHVAKETPEKMTFLPANRETFRYGTEGEKQIDFNPMDYSEGEQELVERVEKKIEKWTKTAIHDLEDPIRVFNFLHKLEDPHLDVHLNPHRSDTVMLFLETPPAEKRAEVLFPCVETDDMTSAEWKARSSICNVAHRHLQAVHERLLTKYRKGINEESEKTRLKYLQENQALTLLKNDFREDPHSGHRGWNWEWSKREEDNYQKGTDGKKGLFSLVEELCYNATSTKLKALRVPVKRGNAIRFQVSDVKSSKHRPKPYLTNGWHAICSPSKSYFPLIAEKRKEVGLAIRENWKKKVAAPMMMRKEPKKSGRGGR